MEVSLLAAARSSHVAEVGLGKIRLSMYVQIGEVRRARLG